MELELPGQRNCLAGHMPQTFGVLKPQNNLWPGPEQPGALQRTVCKDNKAAVIMTARLMTAGLKI